MRAIRTLLVALVLASACGGKSTERGNPSPQDPPSPPAGPSFVQLTVSAGANGVVNVLDPGISAPQVSCGSDQSCTVAVSCIPPSIVRLEAIPTSAHWMFDRWVGGCGASSSICELTVDRDLSVRAEFRPRPVRSIKLMVATGKGAISAYGTLALSTVQYRCDSICTADFDETSQLESVVWPADGFVFAGWGGACSGPTCFLRSFDPGTEIVADFAPAPVVDLPRYDVEDVTHLGGLDTEPQALGEDGSVAGVACKDQACSVFVWNGSLGLAPLPKGFHAWIAATAGGHVAGELRDASGAVSHALADGSDIGAVSPSGVNRSGLVVGNLFSASGELHAFAWSGGTMEDLAPRTGKRESLALAVDDSGTIAVVACDQLFSPQRGCQGLLFRGASVEDRGPVPDDLPAQLIAIDSNSLRGDFVSLGPRLAKLGPLLRRSAWPSIQVAAGSTGPSSFLARVNQAGDAVGEISMPISEGGIGTGIFFRGDVVVEIDRLLDTSIHVHSAITMNERGQILARTSQGPKAQYLLLTPRHP